MTTKIYALTESDGRIRYVGKTALSFSRRFSGHLYEARRGESGYKNNWIRSLLKKGLLPTITLLGEVEGDGCREEIAWIKYFRDEGVRLVNATDGGEGLKGYIATELTRQKISSGNKGKTAWNKGRKGDPAWNKGKIGLQVAWNKGASPSYETRQKISLSKKGTPAWNKGISPSPEIRKKISSSLSGNIPWNKGGQLSEIHRKKLSVAHAALVGVLSPNWGKHLSEETKLKLKMANIGNTYRRGKKCSAESRLKMSLSHRCPRPWMLGRKQKTKGGLL
jgi:hypothetical protein